MEILEYIYENYRNILGDIGKDSEITTVNFRKFFGNSYLKKYLIRFTTYRNRKNILKKFWKEFENLRKLPKN